MYINRNRKSALFTTFLVFVLCIALLFGVVVNDDNKKEQVAEANAAAVLGVVSDVITCANAAIGLGTGIYKGVKAAKSASGSSSKAGAFFSNLFGAEDSTENQILDEVKDISDKLDTMSSEISEINQKIDDLNSEMKGVSEKLDTMLSTIQSEFSTAVDQITVSLNKSQLEMRNWTSMYTQINDFYNKYADVKTSLTNCISTVNSRYQDYNNFLEAAYKLDNGDKIKAVVEKISLNYEESLRDLSDEEVQLLNTKVSYKGKNTKVGKYLSDYISFMYTYLTKIYSDFSSGFSTDMYTSFLSMSEYILGEKAFLGVGIGEVYYKLAVMGCSTNTEVHTSYKQFMANILYDFMLTSYVCSMSLNMQLNYLAENDGNTFDIQTYEDYVENIEAVVAKVLAYSDYEYKKCVTKYDMDGFTVSSGRTFDEYTVYYGNAINLLTYGYSSTKYVLKQSESGNNLTLNTQYLNLAAGENYNLKAYNNYAEVQDDYSWTSSDSSVAVVSNHGRVSGISAGDCTVGVTVSGVYYPLVSVSVSSAYIYSNGTKNDIYTTTNGGTKVSYSVAGSGLTYDYSANVYGFDGSFDTDTSHSFNIATKLNIDEDELESYTFYTFSDNLKVNGYYALAYCNTSGAIIAQKQVEVEKEEGTESSTIAIIIPVVTQTEVAKKVSADQFSDSDKVTSGNTYYIYSKEDLLKWRAQYNGGQNVVLMNDIDFEWDDWSPVALFYAFGGTKYGFPTHSAATFDGNGHTIKNITFTKAEGWQTYIYGFFAYASGTIKNLNFENIKYADRLTTNKGFETYYSVFAAGYYTYYVDWEADDGMYYCYTTDVDFNLQDCSVTGTVEINATHDVNFMPFVAGYLHSTYSVSKNAHANRIIYNADTTITCNGKDVKVKYMNTIGNLNDETNSLFVGNVKVQGIASNNKVTADISKCLYSTASSITSTNTLGQTATISKNGTDLHPYYARQSSYWERLGFSTSLYDHSKVESLRSFLRLVPQTLYADTSSFTRIYKTGESPNISSIKVYEGTTNVTSKGSFSSVNNKKTGEQSITFTYGKKKLTFKVFFYDYALPSDCTITFAADSDSTGEGIAYTSYKGADFKLCDKLFTRENFHQTGWTDGTNTYGLCDVISVSGDITLKPVWGADEFTISYDNAESDFYTQTGAFVIVNTATNTQIESGATVTYGDLFTINYVLPTGYGVKNLNVVGATLNKNQYYTVKGNVDIKLEIQLKTYEVSFYDKSTGGLLGVSLITHGSPAAYLTTADGIPEKASTAQYSYTFEKWDREFETVTQDTSYYAYFTATVNEYTYTFYDEDGEKVLLTKTSDYGSTILSPNAPAKESDDTYTYTFAGWSPEWNEGDILTANKEFTPVFNAIYKEYSLTIPAQVTVKKDGVQLSAGDTVHYGDVLEIFYTQSAGHTKTDFEVSGATLSEDGTYVVGGDVVATYSEVANSYTYTFYDEDGETVLKTLVAYYGSTIEAPEAPAKASDDTYIYSFAGWSPDFAEGDILTGDIQYVAVFVKAYVCTISGHVAGNWVVDKEATEEEDGLRHMTCAICGETMYSGTIDKVVEMDRDIDWTTGCTCSNCVSASTDSTSGSSASGCGSTVYSDIAIVALSIAIVLGFVIVKKQKMN